MGDRDGYDRDDYRREKYDRKRDRDWRRDHRPGHSLWSALMLVCVGCVLVAIGLSFGGTWRGFPWWPFDDEANAWMSDGDSSTIRPVEALSGSIPSSVKRIEVELKAASFVIKTGPSASYSATELKKDSVRIETDGDTFRVIERDWSNVFEIGPGFGQQRVEITLPEGMKFDECRLNLGAGRLIIEQLDTDRFYMESGAGSIDATRVTARNAKLETGAGSIKFSDCSFVDADFETGAGRIEFSGDLTGKSRISTGAGSVELRLSGSADDYRVEYDRGLGSLRIGDETYSGSGNGVVGNRDADRELKLETGVGSVQVRFEK
jgi:hypothetical protein